MMRVSDLEYLVPYTMRCRVYRDGNINMEGCINGKKLEYKLDLFDDYSGGIKFSDLARYDFVWNARISFMEPKGDQLFIVIYNNRK